MKSFALLVKLSIIEALGLGAHASVWLTDLEGNNVSDIGQIEQLGKTLRLGSACYRARY